MTSAVKPGVLRRKSMPAIPAGGPMLAKYGNRKRPDVEQTASERVRKVSFERLVPVSNLGSPRRVVPQRRHSTTQAPASSVSASRPPLASLTEIAPPLEERVTALDLIEACIKDAEVMLQPEPLPKASKDMDEVLKDLQRFTHNEDDEPDVVATEVTDSLNSGEVTAIKENGCETGSAQHQHQTHNMQSKNPQPFKQEEKQLRLRKISAPLSNAPNPKQLHREK